jgi:hypothetical protein
MRKVLTALMPFLLKEMQNGNAPIIYSQIDYIIVNLTIL